MSTYLNCAVDGCLNIFSAANRAFYTLEPLKWSRNRYTVSRDRLVLFKPKARICYPCWAAVRHAVSTSHETEEEYFLRMAADA